jgi:hypothetical protein
MADTSPAARAFQVDAVAVSAMAVAANAAVNVSNHARGGTVVAGLFIAGGIGAGLIGTRSAQWLRAVAPLIARLPPSLLRWCSICWHVTFRYLERH